jgi:acetate kinase
VELRGAEAIVFTGGIGERGVEVRRAICRGLDELGIMLDLARNESVRGEGAIHAHDSRVQVWVVPTNEELIVARQTVATLQLFHS